MNAPMPVSIPVTQMLHVPTQKEVTNVCVMMDIQATGRFVKVRNRPHIDQNIFQESKQVFYIPIHKREGIDSFSNVCLPVFSSIKIFHYCAHTRKPFDLGTAYFTQVLHLDQGFASISKGITGESQGHMRTLC